MTGANGQVGWHLQRTLAPMGEVLAIDLEQLDLTDLNAVGRRFAISRPTSWSTPPLTRRWIKPRASPNWRAPSMLQLPRKIAEECAQHWVRC